MKLLRTDADFRPESKLKSIRKSGGGIYIYGGRVDFIQETHGMLIVLRNNGLRMSSIIFVDMGNGLIQRIYRLNRENIVKIFLSPVFLLSLYALGNPGKSPFVTPKLHMMGFKEAL